MIRRIAAGSVFAPIVFGFSSALAASPGTSSSTWPQWRGPQRDGLCREKGLMTEWPEGGPPLAWKIEGLGKGYSSVSLTVDTIYTMGDRQDAQWVIALNRTTHKERWAVKLGEPWGGNGPRCTPTVDDGRVYAIGPHGDLLCLEAASGKELWRKDFKDDFDGRMMSGWGYSESPLIDGPKLICTPGGKDTALVALDKKTGKLIFKSTVPDIGSKGKDGAAYSSAVVAEVGGIRQYVQLMGRGVVAVAADDGRFLWGYNRIANPTANITTPLVAGDLVFCSSAYGTGGALLKLTATPNKGVKAEEVYFLESRHFQNHHGGVVLIDGHVYGGHGHNDGKPTCLELKTGKILWQDRGPGKGSAAALYADGHLYFRYQDGLMALIRATPKELTVVSTFKLASITGKSWPHPVIVDRKLYIRNRSWISCQ